MHHVPCKEQRIGFIYNGLGPLKTSATIPCELMPNFPTSSSRSIYNLVILYNSAHIKQGATLTE